MMNDRRTGLVKLDFVVHVMTMLCPEMCVHRQLMLEFRNRR